MKKKWILLISLFATINVCAQKVVVVTIGSDTYAAISSDGMARGFENRKDVESKFLYSGILYGYTLSGEGAIPVLPQTVVYRVTRHNQTEGNDSRYNPNRRVSSLFAVATNDINEDGGTTEEGMIKMKMDWPKAAGLLATANNNEYDVESSATNKGCYMYKGKSGTDPLGTWRLPTQRELILMRILLNPLLKTASTTGIADFSSVTKDADCRYWSASESGKSASCRVNFDDTANVGTSPKTDVARVRCVRDITP